VKLVTVEQMMELERNAGVPVPQLMENAGLAVAQEVWLLLGEVAEHAVLVLAGPGNNGGDGLVAARHLHDWGSKVSVYLLKPRDAEQDQVYRQVVERNIPVKTVADDKGFQALPEMLARAEVVIDALLGTGRMRPIDGKLAEIMKRLAAARQRPLPPRILALDVSTGVDCNTGAVDPLCVPAEVTLALGHSKVGLHTLPAAQYCGRIVVADIGIPAALSENLPYELMTAAWARSSLPQRPPEANKGTFGKVLVVAGSTNYIGAAYLATVGAGRVGAGLVTLACARSIYPIMATKLVESTFFLLPELDGSLAGESAYSVLQALDQGYNALLVGCGLGQKADVHAFMQALLPRLKRETLRAVVIDADGLNVLASKEGWWQELTVPAILTPHPGEMSRLTGLPIADIQADRLQTAVRQASAWGTTVILKGAHTVVAAPDGRARISPFANPALASGGTGDVLAGAIAGLVAQGLEPFDAAALAVYLHGRAGEKVRSELGDAGLLASDLLPALPQVIKELSGR
jgi:ADP-dependent NAD(P)H-hydrate dehydratase / NAD(P)H-hydrate epimerase